MDLTQVNAVRDVIVINFLLLSHDISCYFACLYTYKIYRLHFLAVKDMYGWYMSVLKRASSKRYTWEGACNP